MKKDGYAESTIKTTGKRLRMMKRHGVNLNDPEEVKEYIAAKACIINNSFHHIIFKMVVA